MVNAGMRRHRLPVRELIRRWAASIIDHGHLRKIARRMMEWEVLTVVPSSFVAGTLSRRPEHGRTDRDS